MTRVKRGVTTRKRHKKLLKEAKGYWGQRKNIYRRAHETILRAMAFATKGRKLKKRDMRALFITRIKAAAQSHGMKYSVFIHRLKKAGILLNRKMLSQIAIFDASLFSKIIKAAETTNT